ncbi:hypothetical protein QJQ45_003472 [Haematococcus lacustris]|nr:hypothetical protein QJQ45_003472 [Haematococcus lacustris]
MAKKKRKGSDKKRKDVSYALCDNPSLLLVPSQRLVPPKASNDRIVGMAGPRVNVRGIAEVREFVFDPDTQIGVGIDPGVTQAVSAASGVWDPATGQHKADQLRRWKLTKGEVKHASGLNNARRDTERWLAPIRPHLQHLAAASSAGTSLEANLKHITVTLATWDAVWEVYLDPKWARQRLRLYGAQDRARKPSRKPCKPCKPQAVSRKPQAPPSNSGESATPSYTRHLRRRQQIPVLSCPAPDMAKPTPLSNSFAALASFPLQQQRQQQQQQQHQQQQQQQQQHQQQQQQSTAAGASPISEARLQEVLAQTLTQTLQQTVMPQLTFIHQTIETVKSELQNVQYDVAKLSVRHIELEGETREVRAEMALVEQRCRVQLAAMAFSIQLETEQRNNGGVVVFFAPRPGEAAIKALCTSVGVTDARVMHSSPTIAKVSVGSHASALSVLAAAQQAALPADLGKGPLQRVVWPARRQLQAVVDKSSVRSPVHGMRFECNKSRTAIITTWKGKQITYPLFVHIPNLSKPDLKSMDECNIEAACEFAAADQPATFLLPRSLATRQQQQQHQQQQQGSTAAAAAMEEDNQPADPNPPPPPAPPNQVQRNAAAAAAGGPNRAPAGKAPGKTAVPGSRPASPNQVQRSAAAAAAGGPNQEPAGKAPGKTAAPGSRPASPNQVQRSAAAAAAAGPSQTTAKILEEGMEELSMERHGCAKQLVVFFGAATIGTRGGWGADAVLRACRKVVCRPRGKDQDGGRVVLVDEHRTSRVSSAVNGKQPCEVELNTLSATRPAGWKPPAGQVEPRLVRPAWSQERAQPVRGLVWCPVVAPRRPTQAPRSSQAATQAAASEPRPSTPQPAKRSKRTKAEPGAAEPTKGKGKAAKAKPAPQPGRWLDRDCNAALNMQRIGESRWRPLELCYGPDQGALPAKGKEYPGLGYKQVRDKPPKAQQQQQQPAEAQRSTRVGALALPQPINLRLDTLVQNFQVTINQLQVALAASEEARRTQAAQLSHVIQAYKHTTQQQAREARALRLHIVQLRLRIEKLKKNPSALDLESDPAEERAAVAVVKSELVHELELQLAQCHHDLVELRARVSACGQLEVVAQLRAAKPEANAQAVATVTEAEGQADADEVEAQVQQHREQQLADNQRLHALQQQLHDLQRGELQRKEQQLADLVAQQRAALLRREQDLTERQQQLQQQHADLHSKEQQLFEQCQLTEQQARIQTLQQQLHRLQQQEEARRGAEVQREGQATSTIRTLKHVISTLDHMSGGGPAPEQKIQRIQLVHAAEPGTGAHQPEQPASLALVSCTALRKSRGKTRKD